MLEQRDKYIRNLLGDDKKWRNVNEGQYMDSSCSEEEIYEQMFPTKKELERFYSYRKEWFERGVGLFYGDKPLSVNVELVSTCNLACSMCYTISEKFQNSVVGAQRMMPWKIVKRAIDEVSENKIPSISFSWRGESTLYSVKDDLGKTIKFTDVLDYARKKKILEITCLTHGQLITETVAEKIVEAEPTWISFSVDGLREQYNKIRTPPNLKGTNYDAFSKVSESIKLIDKFKKKLKKTRPVIRTNSIYPAVENNFQEYSEYFKSIGVNMITVNEIYDVRHKSAPDELIRDQWYCTFPFQRLTISANGILLPCTGAVNEEKSLVLGKISGSDDKKIRNYEGKVVDDKIESFSIMEAWNNNKINNIRKLHADNKRTLIDPGCRNCHLGQVQKGYNNIPPDWDSNNQKWILHKTLSNKKRYNS